MARLYTVYREKAMANPKNLTPFPSVTKQPLAKKPLCVKVEVDIDEFVRSLPNPSGWLRDVITKAVPGKDSVPHCEECARLKQILLGRDANFQECWNQKVKAERKLDKAQKRIKELEQRLAK